MTERMIHNTPENQAKINEVAEELRGSCGDLDGTLQRVFGDDELDLTDIAMELLHELDDQVMQCDACGWWCETHELGEEQVCQDCQSA